ncbi:adhesive plaque matrix protein 2-like [Stegodyphus dumicola]|uniref:adhesive plaque matrix protein 2-like n=1 Tax=Stegodyphus dumicola TaxID=202533 RepID=UPI0015A9F148|nr:adhesive plaque matrix protein 2-like [Stegodyphus dumicola]
MEPVALYNPEAETKVHTDASIKQLAGMLLQKGEDKKVALVYYHVTVDIRESAHSTKMAKRTVTVRKACDCGEKGTCSFDKNDKKKCDCEKGYSVNNDGKCAEYIQRIHKTIMSTIVSACDCGEYGNCKIDEDGSKVCYCNDGFIELHGKCVECDCGPYSKCVIEGDSKKCICDKGFAENYGKCAECDCGEGSECHFIKGAKACNCLTGYSYDANIGKCRKTIAKKDKCDELAV